MIYSAIKWYALLKGVWRWLFPPPWNAKRVDKLLEVFYTEPMRRALNTPIAQGGMAFTRLNGPRYSNVARQDP